MDNVLGVELEIEPRAAIGNDSRLVEQLAGRMGLPAVVIEKDAGAAVELADDDAFGAIDDEREKSQFPPALKTTESTNENRT